MQKWIIYISLIFALTLGSGALLQMGKRFFTDYEPSMSKQGDVYDPSLSRLNSMSLLSNFIDSIASARGIAQDSIPGYVNLADSIIRMRFYHGLQNYAFADNWIANMMGKYVWSHLGAKVLPEDILKGQKAFCSQSSIVFQEFLKSKDFNVRAVLLPGHFCTEVLVNGNWQFHDVSYKPSFEGLPSLSTQNLIDQPHYIEQAYIYSFAEGFVENYSQYFDSERVSYGPVNAFAARNMGLFHRTTAFLSLWGWVFPLFLVLFLRRFFKTRL